MVYVAGKSSESLARELGLEFITKLGSNESPLGPSSAAVAAVEDAARQMHLYPGVEAGDLRVDIAERTNVAVENVLIGNGSSDVLVKIAASLLDGGGEAIIPEPCFSMYEVAVDWAGGTAVHVPGVDYRFDVAGIVRAITPETRMIFLTNPNNPTGLPLSLAEIQFVLDNINSDITVILDEAYCEYVEPENRVDGVELFNAGHRVVVTRTFSKIHALAGMRVGYGIASDELVNQIATHIPPFYTGSLALRAARASLWDDGHLSRSRDVNSEGRSYLTDAFTELGLRVLPSSANHVLIVEMADVDLVDRLMNQRGFIGRPTESSFGLAGGYRVTVGTAEQNHAFVTNLKEVLESMTAV